MFTRLCSVCAQSGREEADYICWDPPLGSTKKQLTFVNIFRLLLHIYLPSFIRILIILFVLTCTGCFVNKMIYGTRAHRNTWGRVSQAQKWVWKWNDDISYFQLKWLIGVDAGRYTDNRQWFICTCAVVFPPKWWSRLLWCHKTMSQESLMCKREVSIKGEVQLSLRSLAAAVLSSGCLDIHFRVFY